MRLLYDRLMRAYAGLATLLFFAGAAAALAAPGPLAALPAGRGVTYNVVASSQNGAEQASHTIELVRSGPGSFKVSIDGGSPVVAAANPDGSISTTPQVKSAIAPFLQMTAIMRGSPAHLTSSSMWTSVLPVPVKGNTVEVPLTVRVLGAGGSGATVSAAGSAGTSIKHGLRNLPATLTMRCEFSQNKSGILTNAHGSVVVSVQRALGDKEVNNTFTVTMTGP